MTEEERRNRNPAIESSPFDPEAHPVVKVTELRKYGVYILQSDRHVITVNYLGQRLALDPIELNIVIAHIFAAPRAGVEFAMLANDDGSVRDLEGNRIVLRFFTGEDGNGS